MVACRRFIALGDNIDVERVDLDPATETWPAASAAIRVDPEPRNGSVASLYEW
jgi:hypothetical protein